jgi:hypothetical protein
MAGVRLTLEKLTDSLSGALKLRLVGVGDDLVHSFNAQVGLSGQIVDDRADNATQGRQLFQDELGEGFSECPSTPDCAHNHFAAPLPNGLPSRSASSWRDRYCSSVTLQDIDRVRFLWFMALFIRFLFFQMMGTIWYRNAAKSRRIRGNQIVLTGTLQHPFWGDVSRLADAKRRTD